MARCQGGEQDEGDDGCGQGHADADADERGAGHGIGEGLARGGLQGVTFGAAEQLRDLEGLWVPKTVPPHVT